MSNVVNMHKKRIDDLKWARHLAVTRHAHLLAEYTNSADEGRQRDQVEAINQDIEGAERVYRGLVEYTR